MSKAIASTKVLVGDDIIPATIIFSIESGKILSIEPSVLSAHDPILRRYNVLLDQYRDVSPLVVMPGFVDAHVHLNEPGRTEWEGFATGTQAAASGGVTTVIDMPLNAIPPTTTIANFNLKIEAAKGKTWVDVGFWGGMVPTNLADLKPLISMGVRGFKGFLIDSGVDEFPAIDPKYILKAMAEVKGSPTLLMFHAEMQPHEKNHHAVSVEDMGFNKTPKLIVHDHHPHKEQAKFSLEVDDDYGERDDYRNGTSNGSVGTGNVNGKDIPLPKITSNDIEDIDLGMSASFISRAPQPVVDLLSAHPSRRHEEHDNCKLPHNHAGSMNQSVLTDAQAKALSKSPLLATVEPKIGKYANLANKRKSNFESPFLKALELEQKHMESMDSPLLAAQQVDVSLENIDPTSYASFLASRPDNFETTAIAEIINCATKITGVPLHIVHLATHEAIPLIRAAKARNLPITAETCFHYLSLTAEKISNCHTHFKCCPPIRTDDNRKLLWRALRNGLITTVVSDHSPCTPDLKGLEKGDFFSAWGGISSVGFGLPIMYTEGRKLNPPITIAEISRWCSWNTSKQVGLSHTKGKIAVGYDADLLIFDPTAEYIVANNKTYFKNKLTAYDGSKFTGRVMETVVRGKSVFEYGKGHSDIAMGKLILEPRVD
ncbi:hypothetical protein CLIB1423_10S03730 [[Candida] railenensis]|uniref:Amidohydrolase-related domain-containing protein n=1 Tax=[Candida] railenensis TaxID=45579 RepID=A0A9P0QRM0_9ASCO|nr:hypothetical protein CLIB1423_10S03730 [[Candida] railenensis]